MCVGQTSLTWPQTPRTLIRCFGLLHRPVARAEARPPRRISLRCQSFEKRAKYSEATTRRFHHLNKHSAQRCIWTQRKVVILQIYKDSAALAKTCTAWCNPRLTKSVIDQVICNETQSEKSPKHTGVCQPTPMLFMKQSLQNWRYLILK